MLVYGVSKADGNIVIFNEPPSAVSSFKPSLLSKALGVTLAIGGIVATMFVSRLLDEYLGFLP